MSEPLVTATDTTALDASLREVAAEAWVLEPMAPHERRSVLRDEAGLLIDRLLVRVARGRGALDVALGEGLATLSAGDRLLRLGFSCLGDYARERLGLGAATAQRLARLARALAERPVLRAAVRAGDVTARKAETVLPVARGEAEAGWGERARVETVRALQAAVTASHGSVAEPDERWERVELPCPPAARAKLDQALELAGKQLGAASPTWQRLEVICQEFLGAHPIDDDEREAPCLDSLPTGDQLEDLKGWLEHQTRQWAFLDAVPGMPSPLGPGGSDDPPDLGQLDGELRRLARLRDRRDELFGHLAMLLRQLGLWRDMQFGSFGHYCTERLGMSDGAVSQRAALERRLYELPALRRAMRDGSVSYEKARIIAAHADERSVDGWIEKARGVPCISLAREAEAGEDAQMCQRGELRVRMPARVRLLLEAALRAARKAAGRWLRPGEALELVAEHFIATWKPETEATRGRNTVRKRVLERDSGYCQVPGCSRAATQVHHIVFRSHFGETAPPNLTSLCAAHHLHAIHRGWLTLHGQAPDRLEWGFPQLAVAGAGAMGVAA